MAIQHLRFYGASNNTNGISINPGQVGVGYIAPNTYIGPDPVIQYTREDPPMTDKNELRRHIRGAVEQLAEAEAIDERFPSEPPVDTVLMWTKEFQNPDRNSGKIAYVYVAVAVLTRHGDQQWYVTGEQTRGISHWDGLKREIGTNPCWVAPSIENWHELPRPEVAAGSDAANASEWFNLVYGTKKEKTEPAAE